VPSEAGSHVKVHGLVPVAGIHVTPPSVDTATPATTPPLVSEAVPWMTTVLLIGIVAPVSGDVIMDEGTWVEDCAPAGYEIQARTTAARR